ncbi:MAG: sugar phosphate isomerase/epimerase family protein [Armatimonadota bacterium]
MFRLSAFADEISPDLNEQIDVLKSEGITHIELRGVWGKNVLDLSDEDVANIKKTLAENDMGIAVIGSPIGKVKVTDSFDDHLVRFRTAVDMAHAFDTPMVRVFSFFIPEGEDPALYRDEVMFRMTEMAKIAAKEKVLLVHENESNIYGDTGERCLDIIESVGMDSLMACYDPANFIFVGVEPFPFAYDMVADYVRHVHIKDAAVVSGKPTVTPAGEGEGRIKDALIDLTERGYEGFLSLEPHLAFAGQMYGFSGPDQFRRASAALKSILLEV